MKNKHYFRFEFDVEVVFKGRIKCTKSELLDQFQKSFIDFNQMARELQKSTEDNNSSLNQVNFRIIKPNSILKGEDNAFLEGLDRPLYCMLYVIQCCSSFSDAVVTKLLNMNEIAFPDLSKMIRVMLSIPPSTGWIERAYNVLENMSEEVEPVRSWITEAPIFF